MAKKMEKPNDFGVLYNACKEAQLDCQLHVYGQGKKAGLQIEIYKDDSAVDTEQVRPDEKPEATAKRMYKRMKESGKFG